jgi:Prophage tail length tape measure protein
MNGDNVGTITYDARINTKDFDKDADHLEKSAQGVGDSVGKGFKNAEAGSKILLASITAAAAATVAFGVSSFKAFQESQDAIAQTNAVLKSTQGVAGVTADEITDLATKFQQLTKYSDEEVRSSSNMLLTFTNIGKNVFPLAQKAVLDMSAALGQDLKSSSIQLGKALNDPIAGITALSRVGVKFTQQQKDQIKTLVESGKTFEAQQLILKELNTEFGGSAMAQAETFSGRIQQMKNSFNDLQEQIGETIAKALVPFAEGFAKWIAGVQEAGGFIEYFTKIFKENKQTIIVVAGAIAAALVPAVLSLAAAFASVMIPLIPFIAAGALLAYAWQKNKLLFFAIAGALAAFAAVLIAQALPAIIATTVATGSLAVATLLAIGPWILLGAAIAALAYIVVTNFDTIKHAIGVAFDWVKQNWPLIMGILLGPIGIATAAIIKNFDTIKQAFVNVWNWIKGTFAAIGDLAAASVRGAVNAVLSFAQRQINTFINLLNSAINTINKIPGVNISKLNQIALPMLAEGGIVTKPTTAMIGEGGEPEAVIPLSKLDDIMGGSAKAGTVNNIGTINISSEVDGERWLRKLARDTDVTKQGMVSQNNA